MQPKTTGMATASTQARGRHVRRAIDLLDVVGRLPPALIIIGSLGLAALVGLGDYLSGQDLSFSAFYLVPIMLVASKCARWVALGVAAATAAMWFAADIASRDEPYRSLGTPIWNAGIRFLVFAIVIALLDALKVVLFHERLLSREDALCGLSNSRAFYEATERERIRLSRTGRALTLAYFDIDDFKKINDSLGHSAGDEVLRAVAATLRRSLRQLDTPARVGGDEFTVLLPETGRGEAVEVLGRLHDALKAEASRRGWPIGYSMGSVTFTSAAPSVVSMVSETDQVMYEVKRSGKNRLLATTSRQR